MTPRDLDADFRRYAARLHRYLLPVLGQELAADVLQETFLTAVRTASALPGGEDAFEAWLYRTARAKAYEAMRRARRDPIDRAVSYPLALHGTIGGEPADELVIARLAALDVVASLTPAEQELWWLARFEDIGRQEIADLLGISYTNVTTRINRLLGKVRALLAAAEAETDAHAAAESSPERNGRWGSRR